MALTWVKVANGSMKEMRIKRSRKSTASRNRETHANVKKLGNDFGVYWIVVCNLHEFLGISPVFASQITFHLWTNENAIWWYTYTKWADEHFFLLSPFHSQFIFCKTKKIYIFLTIWTFNTDEETGFRFLARSSINRNVVFSVWNWSSKRRPENQISIEESRE